MTHTGPKLPDLNVRVQFAPLIHEIFASITRYAYTWQRGSDRSQLHDSS